MALMLRQSTAVDVLIGPFLDETNATDSEEGESPVVLLSKNGQALAAKNDATTPVHDDGGYYNCELDATDTNTVGTLVLIVEDSANALPVRHEFQVVEEATYDFLYASGATPLADVNAEADTALTDYDPPTKAEMDTAHALLATEAKQDIIDTVVDAIKAVTDLLPNAGALSDLATILADTNELQTDDVPGLLAALDAGVLNSTTIATLATQVSFTLTAGSVDDGAYTGMLAVVEDVATATQKAIGIISAYTGATKTVTLREDPAIFTMAATDKIAIIAISPDILSILADTNELQTDDYPTTIAAIQSDTDDIQTRLPAALVGGRMDADVGAKTGNVPLSAQEKLDVNAEADTALTDYDAVIPADLNDPTAAVIADAVWDEAVAGHVAAGSFGKTDADILADTNELQGDWVDAGRLDVLLDAIKAVTDNLPNSGALNDLAAILTDTGTTLPAEHAALPTAAENADAVWDEAQADHVAAGSFGVIATEIASILVDTMTTLQAELDGIQADTEDIQTRLPAALVGGAMDSDVSAIQANVITATSIAASAITAVKIATDAITAAKIAADAIGASELAADAVTEIADGLLKRDMSAVSGEAARSPLNALRWLRNKWTISGGTLSVKKEDDTAEAWSADVTTASGDPVSEVDPA